MGRCRVSGSKHPPNPARLPMTAIEHPQLHQRIADSFARQGMMQHLGARVVRVAPGEVELWLPYSDKATQQQGGFHGGAIGAIADIAGGYAAMTTVSDELEMATVEYKINFLAMHRGGGLRAIGQVLKPGKRVIVTRAEVIHRADDGKESPCAVIQQTMTTVPKVY